jgi:tetratricopeptide (TPR) repeat protein
VGFTRADLEAGRRYAAGQVALSPSHYPLEMLARAHLWLDEVEQARELFWKAAEQLFEYVEEPGHGDAYSRGRLGGLVWLAGDPEAARPWLEQALEEGRDAPATAGHAAELCYLLGDHRGSIAAAETLGREWNLAHTAAALAAGHRVRARLLVLADRGYFRSTAPYQGCGHCPLSPYDWLAEVVAVTARDSGRPPPTRAEVLAVLDA